MKNIVIVGGGIAGITAALYTSKNKKNKVTLIEKNSDLGGLVSGIYKDKYYYDLGIKGMENSGTLMPFLKDIGLEVPFVKNAVAFRINDDEVNLDSPTGIDDLKTMLQLRFPDESDNITSIFDVIEKTTKYMEVLYGIDNPLFLNMKQNGAYLLKTIVPWMFKYLVTINKIQKMDGSIREFIRTYTNNSDLIDILTQHFFKDTPTFFGLSYFEMHSDYYYPLGGTKNFILTLEKQLQKQGVTIIKSKNIDSIDINNTTLYSRSEAFTYDYLVWCGDMKYFYNSIQNYTTSKSIESLQSIVNDGTANDSVYGLYLQTDFSYEELSNITKEHLFFIPTNKGLSSLTLKVEDLLKNIESKNKSQKRSLLKDFMKDFALKTTYEISIPILRDQSLAPTGKSGIVVSLLFDFNLTNEFVKSGLYDDFKEIVNEAIIDVLDTYLFPNLKEKTTSSFSSSPYTIFKRFNNYEGGITGWSFSKDIPSESNLIKIGSAIKTPFKNVFQASQWSMSPAGLPTSIILGKLAANKINKK